MTLQLLPIYCFNSSVGLFIVSTAMFSDIKWHCNYFICKWNVYTCLHGFYLPMNNIKDVQFTPTTCAVSFLDELEKHIFYIFQNVWRHITARPPPPSKWCHKLSQFCPPPPPLRRDVIFERPLSRNKKKDTWIRDHFFPNAIESWNNAHTHTYAHTRTHHAHTHTRTHHAHTTQIILK